MDGHCAQVRDVRKWIRDAQQFICTWVCNTWQRVYRFFAEAPHRVENPVFLQEVQGTHRGRSQAIAKWPEASQYEFMADEIWPAYAYGRNAVYSDGHHGNAVLSKYPIVRFENHDVLDHIDAIVHAIRNACAGRNSNAPSPHPSP